MFTRLPEEILRELYAHISPADQWTLADVCQLLRYTFLCERYRYVVIDPRSDSLRDCYGRPMHYVGFFPHQVKSLHIPLHVCSVFVSQLKKLAKGSSCPFSGCGYVLVHWVSDKAIPIVKLVQGIKRWYGKVQIRLIQHDMIRRHGFRAGRLDGFFRQLAPSAKLSLFLLGSILKAEINEHGDLTKLKLELARMVSATLVRECYYVLPESLRALDVVLDTERAMMKHLVIPTFTALGKLLKANFHSNIMCLSVEGMTGGLVFTSDTITLPPSIRHFNYFVLGTSRVRFFSENVTHLSIKQDTEVDSNSLADISAMLAAHDPRDRHKPRPSYTNLVLRHPRTININSVNVMHTFWAFPNAKSLDMMMDNSFIRAPQLRFAQGDLGCLEKVHITTIFRALTFTVKCFGCVPCDTALKEMTAHCIFPVEDGTTKHYTRTQLGSDRGSPLVLRPPKVKAQFTTMSVHNDGTYKVVEQSSNCLNVIGPEEAEPGPISRLRQRATGTQLLTMNWIRYDLLRHPLKYYEMFSVEVPSDSQSIVYMQQ